jgi:hypothetical protein
VRLPWPLDRKNVVAPLVAGFAGGMVFFTLVNRMQVLYVYGHELTHWLAAKLFRRRTGRFSVRQTGGHVQVERPNIWIVLAPYFIPLYAVLWTGIYGVVLMCWKTPPGWLSPVFNVGLGITYAFHVRMTFYALNRAQSDLAMHGGFLSLSLILFCNVGLVMLCLVAATGQWTRGVRLLGQNLTSQGSFLLRAAANAARAIGNLFATVP